MIFDFVMQTILKTYAAAGPAQDMHSRLPAADEGAMVVPAIEVAVVIVAATNITGRRLQLR